MENTKKTSDHKNNIKSRGEGLIPLLERRPSSKELEEKHILLASNVAPSLHSTMHDLEKKRISTELERKLEKRPDRKSLVESHIIKDE
ncbi:hypothetical protein BB558_001159 [Smittium angustum]|uniref:RPEL repeat protein n=1 Tax=Smittium angustum TaxID=133377 RepID=A0A2U1IWU0_SMIAN|nr:hypothetical protein BB558_006767 [Smittium angustum]PWA02704.1 hypothetical protein BB558_001159 [Smittium angustum]